MSALNLYFRKVETLNINSRPGRALAVADADMSLWRIGLVDWSRPLETKLRERRRYRIATTTDATRLDDGTYPENGTAFISGWTSNNEQEPGMPGDQIRRLIQSSHAYVEHSPRWPNGWLSIQHPDAPNWFLEAVRANERYRLRLGLQLVRESQLWSVKEPRAERAKAFASGHPLFFNIPYVEFVSR